jgi:hypoxanthine-DNA glycosylase
VNELLRCFKPIVDKRSRVLILGSMPGPEALRKQQYYGFNGNHFWQIIPKIVGADRPEKYEEKIKLVRENRIALWDVLASCVRPGALDSAIKNPTVNDVPSLLKKYPGIRAVFINGRFAHSLFLKHHSEILERPVFYMPSTSPANAAMPVSEKTKKWRAILRYTSHP